MDWFLHGKDLCHEWVNSKIRHETNGSLTNYFVFTDVIRNYLSCIAKENSQRLYLICFDVSINSPKQKKAFRHSTEDRLIRKSFCLGKHCIYHSAFYLMSYTFLSFTVKQRALLKLGKMIILRQKLFFISLFVETFKF